MTNPDEFYDDYGRFSHLEEKYMLEEKEKYIEQKSNESIEYYFDTKGKEIDKKINFCIDRANKLNKNKFYGNSITTSFTAIELIIRDLYLKPLVIGALISDNLSGIIFNHIFDKRNKGYEERELLKDIVKQWGFNLAEINIQSGNQLWESIINTKECRNDFVHGAKKVEKDDAEIALECADELLNLIQEITKKLNIDFEIIVDY